MAASCDEKDRFTVIHTSRFSESEQTNIIPRIRYHNPELGILGNCNPVNVKIPLM